MASIRLQNLTKHFGAVQAVNDLDIEVPHGSFTALLGPSGCGKTTTMNMISGLEAPTAGEIYFDEHPVTRLEPGQRNIGFVFQNYAIFTHMSVYRNLAFGLMVQAKDTRPDKVTIDAEVRRVAGIVGLEEMLDRRAGRLSVNDMQKVALGRSMITNPAIFLLDEPFSNLDAAFRAYMRAELKRIQHELGQTMVYVTHDQVEAMGMADRIAVMSEGVLQQYGTPSDLYDRPANLFVGRFVGSVLMNLVPARFERDNGSGRVTSQLDGARPIAVGALDEPASARFAPGAGLTLGFRPETVRLVAPDDPAANIRATVSLIEPLGARDVVHMRAGDVDVRAALSPMVRPHIGDAVGLVLDTERIHLFDDSTGQAVR
jgi:multiple sugar transport system ATP-binding protein